jgi:hypothetical protein
MMKRIDENLLNLPHSSLVKISDSITKISSDMAGMSGLAGIIGRAVLERAKLMRESLNEDIKPKTKATPKNKTKLNSEPQKVSVIKVASQKKSRKKLGKSFQKTRFKTTPKTHLKNKSK